MKGSLRIAILLSGIMGLASFAITRVYDYRISRQIDFDVDVQVALVNEPGSIPIVDYRFARIVVARSQWTHITRLSIGLFLGCWIVAFSTLRWSRWRMSPEEVRGKPAKLLIIGRRKTANGLLCAIGAYACWSQLFGADRMLPVEPATIVAAVAGAAAFILTSPLLWQGYIHYSAAARQTRGARSRLPVVMSGGLIAGNALVWLILLALQLVPLSGVDSSSQRESDSAVSEDSVGLPTYPVAEPVSPVKMEDPEPLPEFQEKPRAGKRRH